MKKKNNRRFTALAISFMAILHAQSASAASLNVKIRQVDPAGNLKTITCAPNKKCELPLDIKTKTKTETVTVGINFTPPHNILIAFQTPQGFLYAEEKDPGRQHFGKYQATWMGAELHEKPTPAIVNLFEPYVPSPVLAPPLNTAKDHVADLEITVEAAP